MTDPAQVESDAALARRLQEEEFSAHFQNAISDGGPGSGSFNETPNSSSMDIESDVPPYIDTRYEGLNPHPGYYGGTTRGAPSRTGPSPSNGNTYDYPYPMVRGRGSADPVSMLTDFIHEMTQPGLLDVRSGLRDETMAGLQGLLASQGRDARPRTNGPRNQDQPGASVLAALQGALSPGGESGGPGVGGGSFRFGPNGWVRIETQRGRDGHGTSNINMNTQPPSNSPQEMLSRFILELTGSRGGAGGGGNRMQTMFQAFFPNVGFEGTGAETYEDWLSIIERMGGNVNRSATDQEIGNLPTHNITKNMTEKRKSSRGSEAGPSSEAGSSSNNPEEKEKCAICLGDYEEGEEVKTLPCTHIFHSECVDRWLKVNRTCPFCKQSIRSNDRSE